MGASAQVLPQKNYVCIRGPITPRVPPAPPVNIKQTPKKKEPQMNTDAHGQLPCDSFNLCKAEHIRGQ